MIRSLEITPGGTGVVRDMTLSCGNPVDCRKTLAVLESVRETVPLETIAVKEDGSWRIALKRLHDFVISERPKEVEVIDEFEAALYFGSGNHVEIMLRGGWQRLGYYLGLDGGLVTHVLLPISENGVYSNAGRQLKLSGWVDRGGDGQPFYHLGVLTRLSLSKSQIEMIKAEQAKSAPFMAALTRLEGSVIETPEEYLDGLRCNARR